MKSQNFRYILGLLIAVLLGYYIGTTKISFQIANYHPQLHILSKEPPSGVTNLDLTNFWAVLDKVQTMYYDKKAIDSQKLLNGAISGMVGSLGDPYTMYLPPIQNDNFKTNLAGKFEGIGAELGMKDQDIIVVAPLDGSPAEKAGVKPGDTIIKVDGASVAGLTLPQTVEKIRGDKGTKVMLTLLSKGASSTKDISITRDQITIKSVTGWVKKLSDITGIDKKSIAGHENDKVGYIRLSQFGDNTNEEWVGVANMIASERQNGNIKGVVLDVRNNPGGYLTDAVYIASEFIKSGTVVIEDDGNGNQKHLDVSRAGNLTEIPVIVLINKGSASASEILSGALRDHNRAKLLGETSFGKGTVQQALDLGGGVGLHVTVAKWLTPNGTWVGNGKDGKGLKPDISVDLDPKDTTHDSQLEKAVQTLVQ
jgi:carboxyl-terminal processing protease